MLALCTGGGRTGAVTVRTVTIGIAGGRSGLPAVWLLFVNILERGVFAALAGIAFGVSGLLTSDKISSLTLLESRSVVPFSDTVVCLLVVVVVLMLCLGSRSIGVAEDDCDGLSCAMEGLSASL